MKCLALLSLAVVASSMANPAKRFAGFGLSTIGGNIGCVVTGNKLFVNGLFTKNLTDEEQSEFSQYQSELSTFRDQVKQILEQRRQQALQRRQNGGAPPAVPNDVEENRTVQQKLPDPPKKPSFCSDKATTQYVFDGCKVQDGKVYIGNTYARDLTSEEQQQLAVFDEKMTVYQKHLTSNIQQQVEEIFGKQFGALFGGAGQQGGRPRSGEQPEPSADAAAVASSTPAAPVEAPQAPNFCTLVV